MNPSHSSRALTVGLQLLALVPLSLTLVPAARADQNLAGNVTITGGSASGNLVVTGTIDADGNTVSFGPGTSPAVNLTYADNSVPAGALDTLKFSLNRTPASWLWEHSAVAAMRLDGNHQLILFKTDSATAGVTLIPGSASVSPQLALGAATLTASGTALTTNGAFTASGALSASSAIFASGLTGTPIGATNPSTGVFTTITATGQGSQLGSAAGSWTSPTTANTNLLLYNNSATNWSGIGSDTGGGMYFVTGTAAPSAKLKLDTSGNATLVGSLTTTGIASGSGNLAISPASGVAVMSSTLAFAPQLNLYAGSSDANGGYLIVAKSRNGAAVQANDVLGNVLYQGFDGTVYKGAANVVGLAASVGSGFVQGRVRIDTMGTDGLTGTRFQVDSAAATLAPPLSISSTAGATATNTGALIVSGGAGIGENLYVARKLVVNPSGISHPTGYSTYHAINVTGAGNAAGTTDIRGLSIGNTVNGASNVINVDAFDVYPTHGGSGVAGTLTGVFSVPQITSTGNATSVFGFRTYPSLPSSGNITGAWVAYQAATGYFGSTGAITGNVVGFRAENIGRTSASEVNGVDVADQTKGVGNATAFRGRMMIASGKYNLLMDGTAANLLAGQTSITNTTAATSATTGALVVSGGAGVAGDLYVGGSLKSLGTGATTLGGNLGIGISNPGYPIHIQGTTSASSGIGLRNATAGATGGLFVDSNAMLSLGQPGVTQYLAVNLANGNVGIGTGSPGADFDLQRSAFAQMRIYSTATDSIAALQIRNDAQIWQLRTDGTDGDKFKLTTGGGLDAFTVTPAGNVAVGTTAPTNTVDIQSINATGQARFRKLSGGADNYVRVNLGNGVSSNYWQLAANPSDTSANSILNFYHSTSAANVLSLLGDGKVGIGTTAPAAKLHLAGTSSDQLLLDNGIIISQKNVAGVVRNLLTHYTDNHVYLDNPDGHIHLRTSVGNVLVAHSNGNVGIGTSNPTARLHVNAPSTTKAVFGRDDGLVAENSLVRINTAGASNYSALGFDAAGSPTSGSAIWLQTNGNGLYFAGGNATYATLASTAPHMMIAATGEVGIGTTTPASKLEVLESSSVTTTPLVLRNEFGTGADQKAVGIGFRGGNGNWGAIYGAQELPNDWRFGKLMFATRTSDTAGVETKMTILASGNVGIGTTTPTHKLAVNGTIRAKEVIVDTGWADYVFEEDYRLAPLSEVESHIKAKKHLPGIPSAAEVAEHGVSMGDMQAKLLSKVEELTLHLIRLEKENAALRDRVQKLEVATANP